MPNLNDSACLAGAAELTSAKLLNIHMRDLFADDPGRFERFSLRIGEILFDFSKNRITERTMGLLIDLARQSDLGQRSKPCSTATRSTPPKSGRYCTPPCATARIRRCLWMGRM